MDKNRILFVKKKLMPYNFQNKVGMVVIQIYIYIMKTFD